MEKKGAPKVHLSVHIYTKVLPFASLKWGTYPFAILGSMPFQNTGGPV